MAGIDAVDRQGVEHLLHGIFARKRGEDLGFLRAPGIALVATIDVDVGVDDVVEVERNLAFEAEGQGLGDLVFVVEREDQGLHRRFVAGQTGDKEVAVDEAAALQLGEGFTLTLTQRGGGVFAFRGRGHFDLANGKDIKGSACHGTARCGSALGRERDRLDAVGAEVDADDLLGHPLTPTKTGSQKHKAETAADVSDVCSVSAPNRSRSLPWCHTRASRP